MSVLTHLLFKLNTMYKKTLRRNKYIWVSRSHGVMTALGVLNLHHSYYHVNDVKVVVF